MPQWLIYSLAFCGAVDIVMALLKLVTKPALRYRRRFRSQRSAISSQRHTLYSIEGDIEKLRESAKEQNDIMLDMCREMKSHSMALTLLNDWKREFAKEAGPDGP